MLDLPEIDSFLTKISASEFDSLATFEEHARQDRVNHLWAQILSFYWPITENFAIERETYPAEHVGSKADIVLTTCVSDRIVKALFVECKRHAHSVTDRQWDRSKSQLTAFIRRWEERKSVILTTRENHEFILTDISPSWGDAVFDLFGERISCRKVYNTELHELRIRIMPTDLRPTMDVPPVPSLAR